MHSEHLFALHHYEAMMSMHLFRADDDDELAVYEVACWSHLSTLHCHYWAELSFGILGRDEELFVGGFREWCCTSIPQSYEFRVPTVKHHLQTVVNSQRFNTGCHVVIREPGSLHHHHRTAISIKILIFHRNSREREKYEKRRKFMAAENKKKHSRNSSRFFPPRIEFNGIQFHFSDLINAAPAFRGELAH